MSEELLFVQIFEAKPNPMFTEEQRATVRFLHYNKPVPCSECGKRKRQHWTFIVEFLAHSMGTLVLAKSGLVHPPLAPVCRNHLLAPAWPERDSGNQEELGPAAAGEGDRHDGLEDGHTDTRDGNTDTLDSPHLKG
jgi:hypothetical protein